MKRRQLRFGRRYRITIDGKRAQVVAETLISPAARATLKPPQCQRRFRGNFARSFFAQLDEKMLAVLRVLGIAVSGPLPWGEGRIRLFWPAPIPQYCW
jgi:hypothetical protein